MTAVETEPAPAGGTPAARASGTAELVTAAKLRPAQAQGVFRAVLDALARPGTVARFPSDVPGAVPSALLPAHDADGVLQVLDVVEDERQQDRD
ncbi:hypothetical protein ABZ554_07115, partial [Streptomyces sp. NPDC020125]|uniref:hypothetical protein n=1 Tax=Streptomyces sp. NPDC020125 TaxID=3154593 RepID=UPI0033C5179B